MDYLEEKRVILIILALLILAVLLAGVKRYYPQNADSIIYIQSDEQSNSPISGLIRINTATIEELEELSGIGPVIAQRIIDYRNAHGAFKTKDALQDVKGIGIKKLEKFQDQISLE